MNQRSITFRRAGVFYREGRTTGKQTSLRTEDRSVALTLLHAKNGSLRQPVLNSHLYSLAELERRGLFAAYLDAQNAGVGGAARVLRFKVIFFASNLPMKTEYDNPYSLTPALIRVIHKPRKFLFFVLRSRYA